MADFALLCASHSPLMYHTEPGPGVRDRVDRAFADAKDFVEKFQPDLVVLFGADHYNGFFYDMMPPFCIGAAAESVGDYGSATGRLFVEGDVAHHFVRSALAADLDVCLSERMSVDHGFVQPLELLFGGIDRVPVVPVFLNSLAEPLGPLRRIRLLGEALGRAALTLNQRILFVGSGGLSHDPPAPRLQGATAETAARLIHGGRGLTPQQRAERENRVIQASRDFAAGRSTMQPLNPEWDRLVLDTLAAGDLSAVDAWTPEWFVEQAGHSAHEVRTWIAAHAALSMSGSYRVTSSYYELIPAWIAGFAVVQALPVGAHRSKEGVR